MTHPTPLTTMPSLPPALPRRYRVIRAQEREQQDRRRALRAIRAAHLHAPARHPGLLERLRRSLLNWLTPDAEQEFARQQLRAALRAETDTRHHLRLTRGHP